MNMAVKPGKREKRIGASILACALIILPLTGCMSSGASSFSQQQQAARQAAEDPLVAVPLDIADEQAVSRTGVVDATDTGDLAAPLALVEDPIQSGADADPLTTASLVPSDPNLNQIVGPRGEISKEAVALREQTEARLSAIDQADTLLNRRAEAIDAFGSPYSNPSELAAQQRIPALFASIDHGACKGGWGPKPRMINVSRVDPAHRYYMEMRMRHTPLLPVGHVYIAYGQLGIDGEPIDEKLTMLSPLGGYVGAGIASALPMPGILKPIGSDCTVEPEAAYRISLSAQEYEKLLLAIKHKHEEKPTYHLFAYNCNHYLSDVASSVGILPPENIYQPSLTYLYAMMDRNEGREVPRTPTFGLAATQQPLTR